MRPQIRVSGTVLLWFALMILVFPLRWILASVAAAALHEGCHIFAIYLCGGSVDTLKIGQRGATMGVTTLTPLQELFCALAGPAGSGLLVLLAGVFPRLAVCALFHGVYNLLPVYPMDGGRALHCALTMLFGEDRAERACLWVTRMLTFGLLLAVVYAVCVLRLGFLPLLMAGFVIRKANMRKMPCK